MTARLFALITTMEARKLMSYRADFWISSILGFAIRLGLLYFLVTALFRESGAEAIGGMSFTEMLSYYLLVVILGTVIRGREQGSGPSDEIYTGELTRYIIYPTRFFLFKYAQHLGALLPSIVQAALFAVLVFFSFDLAGASLPTPGRFAVACVVVLLANLLNWTMYLPFHGVAFWQDNVWSLCVMVRFAIQFLGGAMVPLALFPGWAQDALAGLPFAYIFAFPIGIIMGTVSWSEIGWGMAIMLAWIVFWAAVARGVWTRGDRVYTGVGI